MTKNPHDLTAAQRQEIVEDALREWRKSFLGDNTRDLMLTIRLHHAGLSAREIDDTLKTVNKEK